MNRHAPSPPQQRRGGCAIKKRRDSHISRADGVVLVKKSFGQHHPVRDDYKDAARQCPP
jgi:hypothetical protein